MGSKLQTFKAIRGDVEAVEDVIRESALDSSLKYPKKEGGRLLPDIKFVAPEFAVTLSRIQIDFSKLGGIKTVTELRDVLVEARRRLGDVKVAVDDWLGKTFEVVGYRLQDVKLVEAIAVGEFVRIANEAVANGQKGGATGFTFMNAYYEMAGVRKPFTTVEYVHDISIRLAGEKRGLSGPDRGVLIGNADGQRIFVTTEFKTSGVAHKMKSQQGKRDDRLFRNPDSLIPFEEFDAYFVARPKTTSTGDSFQLPKDEGAKLTYTIEGRTVSDEIDFENIILLRNMENAESRLDTDYLTKIGVRAGNRGSVKKQSDGKGGHFILLTVPVDTREFRRILEAVIADPSWQ